jgi:hypothetical protein
VVENKFGHSNFILIFVKINQMSGILKEKAGVGVIVCRMQVPYLTDSHKAVIETVLSRHNRVIIFLGVTLEPIEFKNPYSFQFRKSMLEQQFSGSIDNDNLFIVPLPDNKNDNALWVNTLDNLIGSFLSKDETAVLYGSRDSFIPHYEKDNGKFNSVELSPNDYDSGTELRQIASISQPVYSVDTAKAILWTLKQVSK